VDGEGRRGEGEKYGRTYGSVWRKNVNGSSASPPKKLRDVRVVWRLKKKGRPRKRNGQKKSGELGEEGTWESSLQTNLSFDLSKRGGGEKEGWTQEMD